MRKFPEQRAEEDRFSTHVRHYHRRGKPKRTWDEWVDGEALPTRKSLLWLKWLGVVIAIGILAGIGIALYIEMS